MAFVSLLAVAAQIRRALDDACAGHGLTHDQYNVLRILRGVHPDGYPRREIADRLIERAPDVTRFLNRLQRRGLVERARSPADGRLSIARVTAAGLSVLAAADEGVKRVRIDFVNALAPAEQEALATYCGRMLRVD